MEDKPQWKIGVSQGQGPPPGYRWNVAILDNAYAEANAFLKPHQYQHMALQVKEIARENDPTHCKTVSIDKIEAFYEIRDKGGVLGSL